MPNNYLQKWGPTDTSTVSSSHCQVCDDPSLSLRHYLGACTQVMSLSLRQPCEAGVMMICHSTEEHTEARLTCLRSPTW